MNFFPSCLARFSALSALILAAGALSASFGEDKAAPTLSGASWMSAGYVGHSSDTVGGKELDGRALYSTGAQLVLKSTFSDHLEGTVGLGVAFGHMLAQSAEQYTGYAPGGVGPYVAQAFMKASFWEEEEQKLSLNVGLFPYNYMPEVQNLGAYLLRGPVYPGVLISGFEERHIIPVANILGLQLHHQTGGFTQDLLIQSETDFFPFYDFSPAYIASYQFGSALRIGAGANFYHLISLDDSLNTYPNNPQYGSIDSNTFFPFKGIKLMANAVIDIQGAVGGIEALGPEDLKLYGEVAVFGLKNDSAYKATYGDYMHRMPMMAGFNFPAFRILDRLAFEVEWYGAKFADDLGSFKHTAGDPPRPTPVVDPLDSNLTRDNWKWSLYGSKVVGGHVKISFQIANDHFRPGLYTGDGDNNPPVTNSIMMTPKDWNGNLKVAYFF